MKKQSLEEKTQERARLLKSYRASVRASLRTAYSQEPRLKRLSRSLRRHTTPADLVVAVADSWLRTAPVEHRSIGLRLIQAHCDRMERARGHEALDDPMPPGQSASLLVIDLLRSDGLMR